MSNTIYDLFRGNPQENPIWVESVEGLEAAKERMNRLALLENSDFFLFQSGNVIASVKSSKQTSRANQQTRKVVIVSSNQNRITNLSEILQKQAIDSLCAITVKEYRHILSKRPLELVFCDSKLSDGDYRDVINATRFAGSFAHIVVTSRLASWPEFLEAMRVGAFDVISTPCRYKDVEWVIIQAARDDAKRAKRLLAADTAIQSRTASA